MAKEYHFSPEIINNMAMDEFLYWMSGVKWLNDSKQKSIKEATKGAKK